MASVVCKNPVGLKVCENDLSSRDLTLNALQVWSFCQTFKAFLGLIRVPPTFSEFQAKETMLSDELIFKLLTKKRIYETNDLLTYLIDRDDDDEFFHMKDWRILGRILGYKDLVSKE